MITRSISRATANELWMELCLTKGTCWLPVLTDSMRPLIRSGDRVKVARIGIEKVRFGDIVVFRRAEDLIVHRILKRWHTPDGVYFDQKGDAAYICDQIDGKNIIGLVIGLKRGTRIFDFESPPSRIANLFIAAWLKIATACINRLKSSKNGVIIMAVRVSSKISGIASRSLVGVYLVICYAAGLFTKDRSTSNKDEDE